MRRTTCALACLLVLAGCAGGTDPEPSRTAASSPSSPAATVTPAPAAPPEGLPVWYDDDGLHRGTTVERTAVPLRFKDASNGRSRRPYLALVRTGAVYTDPQTDDVWFHPWGGSPRIVGRGSASGPGGDPQGDTAAWFEGWHLVVYDTARGAVISRTREVAGVEAESESVEHVGHGNGWVHVSDHQVVWRSPDGLGRRDLAAGTSVLPWQPRAPEAAVAANADDVSYGQLDSVGAPTLVDVSATGIAWLAIIDRGGDVYDDRFYFDGPGVLATPVEGLEFPGRLSPDGRWLLTGEIADKTHGVAFTDVRTGATWKPFAQSTYAFFSWAYGDVAVMRVNRQTEDPAKWSLVACRVVRRTCETLPTRGNVVLPNP